MNENGKIYTQIIGKNKYCYFKSSYRVKVDPNNKGKTRNTGKSRIVTQNKYLGKLEDVMNKLMDKDKESYQYEIGNFGLEAAAYDIMKSLGLPALLEECFPGQVSGVKIRDYLLVAIINRISQAKPKTQIKKYIKEGILKEILGIDWKKLTSANYWLAYDAIISEKDIEKKRNEISKLKEKKLTKALKQEITNLELCFAKSDKIDKFQREFFKILLKKEHIHSDYLYLDSTNFYNYIENNNGKALLCAKGKNKAGKNKLNQITMMMAVTKDYGIPIIHEIYKGNYNDVTLFPTYLTKLIDTYVELKGGIKEIYLSYDKGNNSENNYAKLEQAEKESGIKLNIIGSLTLSHHKDLLKIPLKKYKNNHDGYDYYSTKKTIFGKDQNIVITFYKKSTERQKKNMLKKIDEYKKKINYYFDNLTIKTKERYKDEEIQTIIDKNIIKYKPYLDMIKVKIIKGKEIKLKITIDKNKVKEEYQKAGKSILFTNSEKLSSEEIIDIYHSKTKIDEDHKILKCPEGVLFHPNWHWTDSKLKVQAFVNIMSLSILKLMEKRFNEHSKNHLSSLVIKELLQEIKMILVLKDNKKGKIKINKLNNIKTELFNIFNLGNYLKE